MKKFYMLGLAMSLSMTAFAQTETYNAPLEMTAGAGWADAAKEEPEKAKPTINAELEYYNNNLGSGWGGCAYAEFNLSGIPQGVTITKATFTYSTKQAGTKNRTDQIFYMAPSFVFDETEFLVENQDKRYANKREAQLATVNTKPGDNIGLTADVTAGVKALLEANSKNIFFQITGNAASAEMYGKPSSNPPALVIEYVDAASTTSYTVNFLYNGSSIKDPVTYEGVNIGSSVKASEEDLAPIGVDDKKYLYESGNDEITLVKDASANVINLNFREASVYSYSIVGVDEEGNTLGNINEGTGFENDEITYYYPEFYLKEGTLYSKKNNNKPNPYFGATGKLDADNKEFVVKYDGATIADVVFYKEAEEMEGFISRNTNNADIRCSNGLGGTVTDGGRVLLATLPAGKYTVFGQVWGTKGLTAKVQRNANDTDSEVVDLWSLESTGSLVGSTSEEFELATETELYVSTEGGSKDRMLDLIYIVKTGDVEADVKVTSINLDKDVIEAEEGTEVQLIATYEPENATNTDFVWSSSNENIATVSQTGLVSILHSGECVITVATADGSVKAECSVSVKSGVTEIESEQAGEMGIYNLMGQRVKNPTKGIYIINGKKVLVK